MKNIKKMLDSSVRILFVLAVLASTFVFAMFQGGKLSWTIFYVILPFILYSILLFLYPMSEMIVRTGNSNAKCTKWWEVDCFVVD